MTYDMEDKNIVTWDIAFSYIQHVTLCIISDIDMRHCHFLKSTCVIGDLPSRAPRVSLSLGSLLVSRKFGKVPDL